SSERQLADGARIHGIVSNFTRRNASDFPHPTLSGSERWKCQQLSQKRGHFSCLVVGECKAGNGKTGIRLHTLPEIPDIDSDESRGPYLSEQDWNSLVFDYCARSELSDIYHGAAIPPGNGGLQAIADQLFVQNDHEDATGTCRTRALAAS